MADEQTTATQEPTPEKPVPLSERAAKLIEEGWSRVTAENATADGTTEEHTAPVSGEPKADEQVPTEEAAKPEAITPEQLADTKFWGQLDKAGWARMEREFPVATAHVKAAIAAGSRIVTEARKSTLKPAAEVADEKPAVDEMKELIRKANSLDENEAADAMQKIIDLRIGKMLPEFGLDREQAKAVNVARNAYANVIARAPEIAKLDPNELDAAVENDPALTSLLETAADLPDKQRISITEGVMLKAAETVTAKQTSDAATRAAADAKKIEATKTTQRKVNSNAAIASNVVVDSPAGGIPKGKRTVEELINSKWNEAAAKAQ